MDANNDTIGDTPYAIEGSSPTEDVHPRVQRLDGKGLLQDGTTSEPSDIDITLVYIGIGATLGLFIVVIIILRKKM